MRLMRVLHRSQDNLQRVQNPCQSLRSFIDLKGKLDLKVRGYFEASDLALVTTEWSFSGTGPDGNPVDMVSKSADVLRHQADGTWRFVIDNPWGTD